MRVFKVMWAAVLLAGVGGAEAAEPAAKTAEAVPPAGSWKLTLPINKQLGDRPLWLIKLEKKDGKWASSVKAAEGMPDTTLENLKVGKDTLRFSLNTGDEVLPFEFRLNGKSSKLRGILKSGSTINPAEMELTTLTSLESAQLLQETIATSKENIAVVKAGFELLHLAGKQKAKAEDVRRWAARTAAASEAYGPRWHRAVIVLIADELNDQKGYETIALTYARQAERLLDERDRPGQRKRVLDVLEASLTKAGKENEAKEIAARIKKLDFTIKPTPFAGRQSKSTRVVLLELFTGAQSPQCVAADLAFDALGKAFKTSDLVRLQYHLPIPGPDPLANSACEERVVFYGRYYGRAVSGTPTVLLNGRPIDTNGGGKPSGWDRYDEYTEALLPLLEKPAQAKLQATAKRQGAKIHIDVTASDVKSDGDNLRLRVALVEEQIAYKGGNNIAEHHHVVRAFAGGVAGEKVVKGKTLSKTLTVDIDQVRKDLRAYLDKTDKATPFPNKDRPLDLKKLRVVAFVQNDATREVLQAIQVDVPAE